MFELSCLCVLLLLSNKLRSLIALDLDLDLLRYVLVPDSPTVRHEVLRGRDGAAAAAAAAACVAYPGRLISAGCTEGLGGAGAGVRRYLRG